MEYHEYHWLVMVMHLYHNSILELVGCLDRILIIYSNIP